MQSHPTKPNAPSNTNTENTPMEIKKLKAAIRQLKENYDELNLVHQGCRRTQYKPGK